MNWRHGCCLLLFSTFGCAGVGNLSDQRPPTTPAPADVQAEIRDARYFLPYPDRTLGPDTGAFPR